jgi:hypothetical protein
MNYQPSTDSEDNTYVISGPQGTSPIDGELPPEEGRIITFGVAIPLQDEDEKFAAFCERAGLPYHPDGYGYLLMRQQDGNRYTVFGSPSGSELEASLGWRQGWPDDWAADDSSEESS